MARFKLRTVTLATFVVSIIGCSFMANAEIDESDRILEAAGPQLLNLNRCYELKLSLYSESPCKALSLNEAVDTVFKSCRLEQNMLEMASRIATPRLKNPALDRLLSEVYGRARDKIEMHIRKTRREGEDHPPVCLL